MKGEEARVLGFAEQSISAWAASEIFKTRFIVLW